MTPKARGLVVIAAAQIGDDGVQWIEVMPTADKARNGRWFFTITSDDLDTYAASIQASAGLIPVDYDHEGSEGGSTVAAGWFTGETRIVQAGEESPAGESQDHLSLWAQVKWTPQAAQEIQDGRFKRISPEYTFAERDSKTGLLTKAKEIIAATLTNRPFFRELAPVGAADGGVVWDESTGYVQRMQEINSALNGDSDRWRYWVMDVGDGKALVCEGDDYWVVPFTLNADGEAQPAPQSEWTPAEQQYVSAPAEAMQSLGRKVAEASANFPGFAGINVGGEAAPNEGDPMDPKILAALGLPEDADDATVLAAVADAKKKADAAAELEEERKRLRTRATNGGTTVSNEDLIAALGLSDDADEAEVLAAVRQAKAGADRLEQTESENEDMKGVGAKNRALETRLKVLEAERMSERVQRILTDGVRAGKVFPAEKASLAKQFARNPDGLAEIIDARPDHAFSLTGRGHGDEIEEGDDIVSVKAEFASEEADGVDTDSARLHVRATQILREQGKRNPTEAEYLEALDQAQTTYVR